MTTGILHHAAVALLARGEVDAATDLAIDLVALNPYDENGHVLLVRCLRASGDPVAARRQVAAATALFRRELGREPTPALRAAATGPAVGPELRVSGRSGVVVELEAAESALAAGAVETGIRGMWAAVTAARGIGDRELVARSLVGLGAALVHAGRGTDEEGVTALHEGTSLAEAAGRPDIAGRGWREIGWVHFLRAEYELAERSLDRVVALDGVTEEDLGWVEVIRGTSRHDLGDHDGAEGLLEAAVGRSERLGIGILLAYALTHLGRFRLLRGETEDATHLLDRALLECTIRGLTAFVPWPESFRGEIDLLLGDVDRAHDRFEHAFTLGCHVGDPCWESIGLRGLGLVAAARGDMARAFELLVQAPRRCRRLPDTYLWIEVYGLDALCSVAVEQGAEAALSWVDQLEATASRRGLREFVARAMVYRARLGEPGALAAANSLVAQIANPTLKALLVSAAPVWRMSSRPVRPASHPGPDVSGLA